jgi:putative oxidoreductase
MNERLAVDLPPVLVNLEVMKIAEIIARVLLGLVFAVFGSNAFLHFIPAPPMTGPSGDFIHAMMTTGYVKVVGFCQVTGGLILLIGRFIPLGLTLLGPVIVNILCFHIFLNHEGWPMAAIVAALALFLLWRHRASFAGLLKP